MDTRLSERDRAEVQRSAEEARKLVVEPIDRAEIERYANPPSDTPYPLEYAFHLLGDVRGKTVLDFGCGTGENIIPLVLRGARVIGLDVSPELIGLARQRLDGTGLKADLRVGSAYATDLPDGSVDVIFSISLIHHLDIGQVTQEMLRILAKGGRAILKEPIRFSASYARLRNLLPARGDISEYEHPLTRAEFAKLCAPFKSEGMRYFRLPFVPLLRRIVARLSLWTFDRWLIRHCPMADRYATSVVVCLHKTD
jgi:SAM-dependent methyltransferase